MKNEGDSARGSMSFSTSEKAGSVAILRGWSRREGPVPGSGRGKKRRRRTTGGRARKSPKRENLIPSLGLPKQQETLRRCKILSSEKAVSSGNESTSLFSED